EQGGGVKLAVGQAEGTAVQRNPVAPSLQVFQPAGPEEAAPVVPDPTSDRLFSQVAAGFFALDPLELVCLTWTVVLSAEPLALRHFGSTVTGGFPPVGFQVGTRRLHDTSRR